MLTSIILKDYTTFINETIFDFRATNYKILDDSNVGDNRILKGALFVGENASGKTQVLKSIVLLLDLLLDNTEQNYVIKKSMYTKGTKFSLIYTFNIDNNIIRYEVEFKSNTINCEKLYLNNEIKLERLKTSGITYFGEKKDVSDINPSLSLLKLEYYNTRFNNDSILNSWFDFLKNSIYINCLPGGRTIKSYNPAKISEQFIEKYAESNDAKKLNSFINKLGYNSEVVFNKQSSNTDKTIVINSDKEIIGLKKKGTDFVMPLPLESTGNKAFMGLILPINYAVKNNCMIIIDEFSSGLHNELEEALIKYFFNNSKNSQLFFTSHSTNLLDTSILRPDQIYSFRFDSKEGTLIKRFSDENPRESQNIEKMYLNGVFDGMPKYNKEFKN
jgi:hypothetical protein